MPVQQDVVLIHRQQTSGCLQGLNLFTGIRDRGAVICDGLQTAVLTRVDLIRPQGIKFGEKGRENGVAARLRGLRRAACGFEMDQAGLIHQTHAGLAQFGALDVQ